MKRYAKALAVAILLAAVGLQTGCDQNDVVTDAESAVAVGKGAASQDLGQQLAADPDFRALRKLLHDADVKARLKYAAGANLKADLAFAESAAKKKVHSRAERARIAQIRGFSEKDLERVYELRKGILERFPEITELTHEELYAVLESAGAAGGPVAGKTLDKCSDCNYAYNSCSISAEIRLSLQSMGCTLLLQSPFAAGACYLAAFSSYMWTISSCRQRLQYCLSANGCNGLALNDTL